MLTNLHGRPRDETGFTLIELLVVILIIGILAAIAIPSFLNQKDKANDASTKSMARTAQTAAETYATDHNGSYVSMDAPALKAIESTIPIVVGSPNAVSVTSPTSSGYTVTSTGSNGHVFNIVHASGGVITHTCTPAGSGGCQSNGTSTTGTW
jgi:type IV pilus assembly protein PilA